jgi:serine/threonine-protein kinase
MAGAAEPRLRTTLEELLLEDGDTGLALPERAILEGPLGQELLERMTDTTAGLGERVGSVELVEVLGEGGMGTVFRGHDAKLGRAVAVKTLRVGAGLGASGRERFRREARILSRLDHPGICRIYDLVERPEADYLVLELVEGETLRRYLERRVSRSRSLELARAVTEAVAAAHAQGIVHRDLKPENVMVRADGAVKVLDFGIARALERAGRGEPEGRAIDDEPGGRTATEGHERPAIAWLTARGQVTGTPAYMSPEQARGAAADAPSDVWALGVVLHELFSGFRPFGEDPAPLPTTHPEVRLARALDRDVARLLGRMLAIEPLARPTAEEVRDRLAWIARRPIRTRRRSVAVVLAALALFGGARYVLDVRAERVQAEAAREESEEIVRFLVSLFELTSPDRSLGETITARELLARGSERIAELSERPVVQARLEATLGAVYRELGLYEEAAPHLERALARRQELLGESHLDTLDTATGWGELELLRGRVESAETIAADVIERSQHAPHGRQRDALLVQALELRGAARRHLGRFGEAESDKRAAVELANTLFGPESHEAANAATGLALVLDDQGRLEEAEELARRAYDTAQRVLPAEHPDRLDITNNLALVLTSAGRREEALPLLQAELAIEEKVLGPDHPSVGIALDNLAIALAGLGRLEEAEPLVRRAAAIFEAAGGEHHHGFATTLHNLGSLARELGRLDEAAEHFERALAVYQASLGNEAPTIPATLRGYAAVRERQGREEEAAALLARALAIDEKLHGADSPVLALTLRRLAAVESARGRHGEAERHARRALGLAEAAASADDPGVAEPLDTLERVLRAAGRRAEADAIEARRARLAVAPS